MRPVVAGRDQSQLSVPARDAIQSADGLDVSAISAWEIAIAASKKRIELQLSPADWFRAALAHHQIRCIDVAWEIAAASVALPAIHGDPGDRMIIATALAYGLPIVTPDRIIPGYPGIQVIW